MMLYMALVAIPSALYGRVKSMGKKEKSAFFDSTGRRILAKDSMLAFISAEKVASVGLVVRREKGQFTFVDDHFVVGVKFEATQLIHMLSLLEDRNSGDVHHRKALLGRETDCYVSVSSVLLVLFV